MLLVEKFNSFNYSPIADILKNLNNKFDEVSYTKNGDYYAIVASRLKCSENLKLVEFKFLILNEDIDKRNLDIIYLQDPRKKHSLVDKKINRDSIGTVLEEAILYNHLDESYIKSVYIDVEKLEKKPDYDKINKIIKEQQKQFLRSMALQTTVGTSATSGTNSIKRLKGIDFDVIGLDLKVY